MIKRILDELQEHKIAFMFILAGFLTLFGCALLLAGFIVEPMGEISHSVMISAGEVFTFAGSVLGINTTYKSKLEVKKNEVL